MNVFKPGHAIRFGVLLTSLCLMNQGLAEDSRAVTGMNRATIATREHTSAGTVFAPGDANCDGLINRQDAKALAMALTDGRAYREQSYACPTFDSCDVNRDRQLTLADIDSFEAQLGEQSKSPSLRIGPIEGLTIGWHPAPVITAVPIGTVIEFRVGATPQEDSASHGNAAASVPTVGLAEAPSEDPPKPTYRWEGAIPVGDGHHARAVLDRLGAYTIAASRVSPGGFEEPLGWSTVVVTDASAESVRARTAKVAVSPRGLSERLSNEETYRLYRADESIAMLQDRDDVAPETRAHERRISTSINRTLLVEAQSDPPGFAPLLELCLDDMPIAMGGRSTLVTHGPGIYRLDIGPPGRRGTFRLDTYSVEISRDNRTRTVEEGVPVTFRARTEPPGYEDQVVWLASTRYGTARPTLGAGPTFTVQFENTFDSFQWLGVRADNAVSGQDQEGVTSGSTFLTTISANQFIEIPAGFFGPTTDAFAGEVNFVGESVIPGTNVDTVMDLQDNVGVGQTTVTELTEFRNLSQSPITVTGSGPGVGSYDIVVSISPTMPAMGEMTILSLNSEGGTYDATVELFPYFEFHPVGGGPPITVDTANPPIPGFPLWLGSSNASFTFTAPPSAYSDATSSNFFYDGLVQIVRTDVGMGQYACAKDTATFIAQP